MTPITILLLIVALLTVVYLLAKSPPIHAMNENSTAGTKGGNHTFTASVAIKENLVVKLANPGDPHERSVVLFDGTGVPLGISIGCSAIGEPIGVHLFGASSGSVKLKTKAGSAVTRLGKLVPAANGEAVLAGDASAVSTQVLGIALEANDDNHEIEISPATLVSIVG